MELNGAALAFEVRRSKRMTGTTPAIYAAESDV